jgi:hypothetical protein
MSGELGQGRLENLLAALLGASSLCDCLEVKLAITH